MSEATNMPQNTLIDGRYRIIRKIADGGMATVYQAVDVRLGRDVALKIMHTQLAQGPHRDQFVERFKREAHSAAAIANPHVVQVYDTGENNGLDYLVMEYVHGVNLRHDMQTKHTFSVRETLRIVGETLDGLAAAHRAGVVHRDIKPENILINDRGRVQITDFGLAKAASQATLSSTGMLLGTAAYLAPEMIEQNLATPQGDCYAVGIMAWEMLTGQVPFLSDNPVTMVFKHVNENVPSVATICTGIDPQVARFISYLTSRQVDDRPPTAADALSRLRELMPKLTPQALAYRYDPNHPAHQETTILPAALNKQPAAAGTGSLASTPPAPHASLAQDEPATVAMAPVSDTPEASSSHADATAADAPAQHGAPTLSSQESHDDVATVPQTPVRRRRGWIIPTVLLVVLAAAAGGFAWWYFAGPGSYSLMPSAQGLQCQDNAPCKITNVAWSTYSKALDEAQIPYNEPTEEYSDTVAKGDVISTDPDVVDAHVNKRNNQHVKVVVSLGVRQVQIPDNIMDSTDPLADLKSHGIEHIDHQDANDQWSLDVPAGKVISIDPQPGTTINHSATVTVVLSKGPMPVQMPDVIGKQVADAKAALEEDKLTVSVNEEYSDTVASGQVISTSQGAGTQLHWGDAVTLTVSKGPQMVTIPKVTGMNVDEAKKQLESLGLEVKISAPLGNILHTVRIQSPDAGEQVRLRDKDGKKTVITLTVI